MVDWGEDSYGSRSTHIEDPIPTNKYPGKSVLNYLAIGTTAPGKGFAYGKGFRQNAA